MKKKLFICALLLAILGSVSLVGCQKESDGIPTTIRITPDKTHYQTGVVLWDAGDQIAVIRGISSDDNLFRPFDIASSSVGSSEGVFSGTVTVTEGNYHVVYPYEADNLPTVDMQGLHLVAVKPVQTLAHGTFGSGDNVCVGVSESTDVYMQNLGGLLKIRLQADATLAAIRITDNDGQKLAGPATVSLYGEDRLSIQFDASATSTITANAPAGGIDIRKGETFYVVVPPITLHNYTITLVDINGLESYQTYTGQDHVVNRLDVKTIDLAPTVFFDPNNAMVYSTNDASNNLSTQIDAIAAANHTTASIVRQQNGSWKAIFAGIITSIPSYAFSNCSTLTAITLPNTITAISSYAFKNCVNLATLQLPSSLRSMGNGAFEYCSSLRRVDIPNGISGIPLDAFYRCSSLNTVVIPSSVTVLRDDAFGSCSSLTTVYCLAVTPPYLTDEPFYRSYPSRLYVPESSVSRYRASAWADLFNSSSQIQAGSPSK
ncbi:MAG: leucine-rich repeat domain-containing protein [Bacteroidales bacterium]|nr:leucine-rich repeat domain-containing protein [Bacteroidales bacterium]